jgi:hypothetical protein
MMDSTMHALTPISLRSSCSGMAVHARKVVTSCGGGWWGGEVWAGAVAGRCACCPCPPATRLSAQCMLLWKWLRGTRQPGTAAACTRPCASPWPAARRRRGCHHRTPRRRLQASWAWRWRRRGSKGCSRGPRAPVAGGRQVGSASGGRAGAGCSGDCGASPSMWQQHHRVPVAAHGMVATACQRPCWCPSTGSAIHAPAGRTLIAAGAQCYPRSMPPGLGGLSQQRQLLPCCQAGTATAVAPVDLMCSCAAEGTCNFAMRAICFCICWHRIFASSQPASWQLHVVLAATWSAGHQQHQQGLRLLLTEMPAGGSL